MPTLGPFWFSIIYSSIIFRRSVFLNTVIFFDFFVKMDTNENSEEIFQTNSDEIATSSGSSNKSVSNLPSTGKKRSWVWNHFQQITERVKSEDIVMTICKYCKSRYAHMKLLFEITPVLIIVPYFAKI